MPRRKFAIKAKVPLGDGTSTFWHRVGNATEMEDGTILISLASVPLNWNGEARLYVDDGKFHGKAKRPEKNKEKKEGKSPDDIPF